MQDTESTQLFYEIPLLPLRDVVVHPSMVIPLFVGREKSIKALEQAMSDDKQILLVAQMNASEDDPTDNDIYEVGTVASILQLLKLPDGTVKVLVEGGVRVQIEKVLTGQEFLSAEVRQVRSVDLSDRESEVLVRSLMSQFEQYVKLS